MAKPATIEIDYRQTLKRLDMENKKTRRELNKVVNTTSKSIENNMANIISREATNTGRLANSVRAKRSRPKAMRPIPKEERGLFKTVHTRNRTGRHWTFTDSGTRVRRGNRWVFMNGRWVFVRTKGSIQARNFRRRAQVPESLTFTRNVMGVTARNVNI